MKRLLVSFFLAVTLSLTVALAQEPRNFEVRMANGNKFEPEKIEVQVGDTITWINDSQAKHSATPDTGTPFMEVVVEKQKFSKRVEMTKEGTTPYHCKFHPAMTGEIKVVAKGASSGRAGTSTKGGDSR